MLDPLGAVAQHVVGQLVVFELLLEVVEARLGVGRPLVVAFDHRHQGDDEDHPHHDQQHRRDRPVKEGRSIEKPLSPA